MPVSYEIDERLLVVRTSGQYSISELRRAIAKAMGSKGFPEHAALVLDLSGSEAIGTRKPEEMRHAIATFAVHGAAFGGRVAFVTATAVQFGMARMASLLGELRGVEIRVFEELEDALSWAREAD